MADRVNWGSHNSDDSQNILDKRSKPNPLTYWIDFKYSESHAKITAKYSQLRTFVRFPTPRRPDLSLQKCCSRGTAEAEFFCELTRMMNFRGQMTTAEMQNFEEPVQKMG